MPGSSQADALLISTKDLTLLAESIAKSQNPKRPPSGGIDTIISIFRHVVSGRRECAAFVSRKTFTKERQHQDRTHQSFINVLSVVLEDLTQTRQYSLSKPEKKKKGKNARSKGRANPSGREEPTDDQ